MDRNEFLVFISAIAALCCSICGFYIVYSYPFLACINFICAIENLYICIKTLLKIYKINIIINRKEKDQ
jgi:hypothetical protein